MNILKYVSFGSLKTSQNLKFPAPFCEHNKVMSW